MTCLRAQIDCKQVLLEETLLYHVVHNGCLTAGGNGWVSQAKDSAKLSHHKVLTWLVGAQTNLLTRNGDARQLMKAKRCN